MLPGALSAELLKRTISIEVTGGDSRVMIYLIRSDRPYCQILSEYGPGAKVACMLETEKIMQQSHWRLHLLCLSRKIGYFHSCITECHAMYLKALNSND